MSKKHDEPKLTPEQEKLASQMQEDFAKLAAVDKDDTDKAEEAKQADTYAEEPRPVEPERFYNGGATAEEIANWREVHGKG